MDDDVDDGHHQKDNKIHSLFLPLSKTSISGYVHAHIGERKSFQELRPAEKGSFQRIRYGVF